MTESLRISLRSTKVAKIIIVHGLLTFLRRGQVCSLCICMGKMFRISNDFSSVASGPILLKFHLKPPWGRGMKDC